MRDDVPASSDRLRELHDGGAASGRGLFDGDVAPRLELDGGTLEERDDRARIAAGANSGSDVEDRAIRCAREARAAEPRLHIAGDHREDGGGLELWTHRCLRSGRDRRASHIKDCRYAQRKTGQDDRRPHRIPHDRLTSDSPARVAGDWAQAVSKGLQRGIWVAS